MASSLVMTCRKGNQHSEITGSYSNRVHFGRHTPSSSLIITSTVQSRSTDMMILTRNDGYPEACQCATMP
jgi:hypothetical protein